MKKDILKTLKDLVEINSYSFNREGLSKMEKKLTALFSPLAEKTESIPLKPALQIDNQGNKIHLPLGNALSFRMRKNAPLQLFFSGHMDTVFKPDSPFQKFELTAPNRAKGPGCTDMKGGLLVILLALKELEKSPFKEMIGWEVFINPDEEIGSVGSRPHLEKRAKHFDLALVFEPAYSDGAYVSTRKGSINITLVSRGKSAHAGRDFHKGRNAIYPLAKIINGLKVPGAAINFSEIQSLSPFNIVPDLCVLKMNIRADTQKPIEKVLTRLQKLIQQENRNGISVNLFINSERPPKPFPKKSKEWASTLDPHAVFRPSGGVSDANIFSSLGLPTLDTLGVIGGDIHTENEYIEIDSLFTKGQMIGDWLKNLCEAYANQR